MNPQLSSPTHGSRSPPSGSDLPSSGAQVPPVGPAAPVPPPEVGEDEIDLDCTPEELAAAKEATALEKAAADKAVAEKAAADKAAAEKAAADKAAADKAAADKAAADKAKAEAQANFAKKVALPQFPPREKMKLSGGTEMPPRFLTDFGGIKFGSVPAGDGVKPSTELWTPGSILASRKPTSPGPKPPGSSATDKDKDKDTEMSGQPKEPEPTGAAPEPPGSSATDKDKDKDTEMSGQPKEPESAGAAPGASGDDVTMTDQPEATPSTTGQGTQASSATPAASNVPPVPEDAPVPKNLVFTLPPETEEEQAFSEAHTEMGRIKFNMNEVELDDADAEADPDGLVAKLHVVDRLTEHTNIFKKVLDVEKIYNLKPDKVFKQYRGRDAIPGFALNKQGDPVTNFFKPEAEQPVVVAAWDCLANDLEGHSATTELFSHWKSNPDSGAESFLRISFGLGTQLPFIKLKVLPPRVEGQKSEPVYVTIFGTHLSYDGFKGNAPLRIVTGNAGNLRETIHRKIGDQRPDLNKMARESKVTEIKLKLLGEKELDHEGRQAKPIITGHITVAELQAFTDDALSGREDQPKYAKFLGLLHAGRMPDLSFFLGYTAKKQSQEYPEHIEFAKYFQAAMILCGRLGHLWMFRMQAPDVDWMAANFPFKDVKPPRWTVTKWYPKDSDWSVEGTNEPARWSRVEEPHVWPGEKEFWFFTRIALSDERKWQYSALERLLDPSQNMEHEVILRRNMNAPANMGYYIAEIYPSCNTTKLRDIAPAPDTSLTLFVGDDNLMLKGRVTAAGGVGKAGVEFIAALSHHEPMNFGDAKYKCRIKFTDDSTVFERQMRATFLLQAGQERKNGVHIPSLVSGCPIPKNKDTDFYRRNLGPNQRHAYASYVNTKRGSSEQRMFSKQVQAPPDGYAGGQGPAGTGKSSTLVTTIQALAREGKVILVTAPTNGAVEAIMGALLRDPESEDLQSNCVLFTGDFAKSGYKGKQKPVVKAPPPATAAESSKSESEPAPEASKAEKEREFLAFSRLAMADSDSDDDMDDDDEDDEQEDPEDVLMQSHFYQQSVAVLASDNESMGFNRRRLQYATLLRDRTQYAHSRHAKKYLQLLKQGKLSKKDRQLFIRLENLMDKDLLERQVQVVFATCVAAGHATLTEWLKPDVIIIDEAAAATTGDKAVPLANYMESAKTVVMVGDQQQLKPTFISGSANSAAGMLETNIFRRLTESGPASMRMDFRPELHFFPVQHRSHPDITDWTNKVIYDGRLTNGPSTMVPDAVSRAVDQFLKSTRQYFDLETSDRQRYRIGVDVGLTKSVQYDTDPSPWNEGKLEKLVEFANGLLIQEPLSLLARKLLAEDIHIVTPYGGQKKALLRRLRGDPKLHPECRRIKVSTVGTVQGQEAPIVLTTLVQYNEHDPDQVGFIRKFNILNVAATRAQKLSVTFGSFRSWMQAIADKKKNMMNTSMKYFVSFVQHFFDKGEIIWWGDLAKLMADKKVTRATGNFPRTFLGKSSSAVNDDDLLQEPVEPLDPDRKKEGKKRADAHIPGDMGVNIPDAAPTGHKMPAPRPSKLPRRGEEK